VILYHGLELSLDLFIGAEPESEVAPEEELQRLRQFDLNWRFGPCTGRWHPYTCTLCRKPGIWKEIK